MQNYWLKNTISYEYRPCAKVQNHQLFVENKRTGGKIDQKLINVPVRLLETPE